MPPEEATLSQANAGECAIGKDCLNMTGPTADAASCCRISQRHQRPLPPDCDPSQCMMLTYDALVLLRLRPGQLPSRCGGSALEPILSSETAPTDSHCA